MADGFSLTLDAPILPQFALRVRGGIAIAL